MMKKALLFDVLGIITSVICLVHCLILPVLVYLSPVILPDSENEFFEKLLLLTASFLASFLVIRGYNRHGFKLPMIMFVTGLGFVIVKVVFIENELFVWFGSACFIAAHWLNIRAIGKI